MFSSGQRPAELNSDKETQISVGSLSPRLNGQEGKIVSAAGVLDSSVVFHRTTKKGNRAQFPSDRQLRSKLLNLQNSSHILLND